MADLSSTTENDRNLADGDGNNITSTAIDSDRGIDVNIINDVTGLTLQPRFETSTSNVAISASVDTSIFTFSGVGALQSFMVTFDKKEVDMILEIDTTEVLRIGIDDLGDSSEYNLGDVAISGPFSIRTGGSAESIIVDFGGVLSSFGTSFELLAVGTSGAVVAQSHIVVYREST